MINKERPSWLLRRIAIFGLLFFCGLVIGFVLLLGDPANEIHTTATRWAFAGAMLTVFLYAGFATLEDISLAKLIK